MEFKIIETIPKKSYVGRCFDEETANRLRGYLNDSFWFLACKKNKILGFISVKEISQYREIQAHDLPIDFSIGEFKPFVYVEMAYVSKKFRNKEIWKRLRNRLDELAEKKKLGIVTEVENSNSFLIKKLKAKGYKKIAESRDYNYLYKINK